MGIFASDRAGNDWRRSPSINREGSRRRTGPLPGNSKDQRAVLGMGLVSLFPFSVKVTAPPRTRRSWPETLTSEAVPELIVNVGGPEGNWLVLLVLNEVGSPVIHDVQVMDILNATVPVTFFAV